MYVGFTNLVQCLDKVLSTCNSEARDFGEVPKFMLGAGAFSYPTTMCRYFRHKSATTQPQSQAPELSAN